MGLFTKAVTTLARGLSLTSPQFFAFLSGGPTAAGKRVTVEAALQLDTVWACVRLISQTIATLPLPLYRRNKDGHSDVASDHPLYSVIHDRPNADMTAVEFWLAMVACLLLWGNAYAKISRGYQGRVIALTPWYPDRTQVTWQADGTLLYTHRDPAGFEETVREEDVLHVRGFSLDGRIGLSPVAAARQSLGSAIAAEEAAGAMYANGMRPSGLFESPAYLTEPQRKQAQGIIDRFSGSQATGKTPLLEGGWKFTPLTINPEDAQLLETRSFNVEQICRWFDVPPIMIGHMEKSTAWGTGMEQMMLWFLTFSLRPRLKAIEQAISKKCLTPAEQSTMYAEFNAEGLLRTDSKGRAELYKVLATNGLRTLNELRALDNLPPLPGGDVLIVPANMLPIDLLGKVTVAPKEKLVTDEPVDPEAEPNEPAKVVLFKR